MNPVQRSVQHLEVANGWLGLGDVVSANNESDEITPGLRAHPTVLLACCDIYTKAQKLDYVLTIAQTLVQIPPGEPQSWIHRSFALHKMNSTQEAFDLLLPAEKMIPKSWRIPYHLACSCAQLRRWKDAAHWLEKAFALGDSPKVKLMALDDPDLEPLWTNISKIQRAPFAANSKRASPALCAQCNLDSVEAWSFDSLFFFASIPKPFSNLHQKASLYELVK